MMLNQWIMYNGGENINDVLFKYTLYFPPFFNETITDYFIKINPICSSVTLIWINETYKNDSSQI